jgi:hypothetical protein
MMQVSIQAIPPTANRCSTALEWKLSALPLRAEVSEMGRVNRKAVTGS